MVLGESSQSVYTFFQHTTQEDYDEKGDLKSCTKQVYEYLYEALGAYSFSCVNDKNVMSVWTLQNLLLFVPMFVV